MNRFVRHRAAGLCFALLLAGPHTAARAESVPAVSEPAASQSAVPESADWGAVPHVDAIEAYDPLLDADFDEDLEEELVVHDPFEPTNRALLSFNNGLNHWVMRPIADGYRFVVPDPVRHSIRRALINLNSPSTLVNDLLQLRFRDAGETLGRFLLNTTVGWGGLFDVAVEAGWEHHSADFGQTLAKMGVGSGPYLVLPVLGPNTVRDGVGDIVDIFMQPLTYLIGPAPNLMIGTGRGIAEFEARADALEALEDSSVDYYAALRSAYVQSRRAALAEADDDVFDTELFDGAPAALASPAGTD